LAVNRNATRASFSFEFDDVFPLAACARELDFKFHGM
jgi:hypothetical protein